HVVVTSVARDDLADGGASVFAECIRQLRRHLPTAVIEVLTPDFNGDTACIDIVLGARPDIFNHNLETVERLTPKVRSKATYRRSLAVLDHARSLTTKSGLMLGLGETQEEIFQALKDLRDVGCRYLTIGQSSHPSAKPL